MEAGSRISTVWAPNITMRSPCSSENVHFGTSKSYVEREIVLCFASSSHTVVSDQPTQGSEMTHTVVSDQHTQGSEMTHTVVSDQPTRGSEMTHTVVSDQPTRGSEMQGKMTIKFPDLGAPNHKR